MSVIRDISEAVVYELAQISYGFEIDTHRSFQAEEPRKAISRPRINISAKSFGARMMGRQRIVLQVAVQLLHRIPAQPGDIESVDELYEFVQKTALHFLQLASSHGPDLPTLPAAKFVWLDEDIIQDSADSRARALESANLILPYSVIISQQEGSP